jgi:hypothetical protein
MEREKQFLSAEAVTQPPLHHFVGYYDKCCWDASERYIFCQESAFRDRNPDADDPLTIGLVDLHEGNRFKPLTQTYAWNWQQGAMLRWLPPDEDRVLVFNDRRGDSYVTVFWDIEEGEQKVLPWPLYDISPNGRLGTSMNFERITSTRPGYGYFGNMPDPYGDQKHPPEDGVYVVDLESNERKLIFSLSDALDFGEIKPPADHKSWVNCLNFRPSGDRFLFLHRWAPHAVPGHEGFFTRMFTINVDGSEPRVLLEGLKISHFDWHLDDDRILVWLESPERGIHGYCIVHDSSGEIEEVSPGLFESDGHCNLSPDNRWMITDTYPKGPNNEQALILYHLESERRIDVGAFSAMPVPDDSMRCDLHTRWNRDGSKLCFDSTHEGSRQVYIMDVSSVTK